ncbi:MAG: hypothetical protein Q3X12_01240, partial [Hallella sp.]|nr:hypothetical protein [Hallella sp.]
DNHVSFGNIVFGLASAQHSTGFVGCATLSASKRRKIIGKVLFVLLSIVAVAIMLFVAWIYTHN